MTGKPREDGSASGTLYLLATPIGNLQDITLRALETLRQVQLIACEDTRRTRILLEHHQIRTRPVAYHQHNEHAVTAKLLEQLAAGHDVALVADAGTPLISDPGFLLVRRAVEQSIRVVPLPGPSAVLAALAAAGLPCQSFVFLGYPPPKAGRRGRFLKDNAAEKRTMVLFEAPHRLAACLTQMTEVWGSRRAVVARELTKVHEEFRRGTLPELAEWASGSAVKGEITLVVEGNTAPVPTSRPTEEELAALAAAPPGRRNEEMRRLGKRTGLSRSQLYDLLLAYRGGPEED